MLKHILNPVNILLSLLFLVSACVEEEVVTDQNFSSDNFSVLKVSEGDNRIESGESGISAFELKLNVVFSHAVEPTAIEENLSVSGDAQYSISYDSSNSVATLNFELLEYETEYVLNLPAGTYGANGESTEDNFSINFTTRPFITPVVTLSTDNESPEEGNSTVITANLSETTTADVKVGIEVTGTAISGEDYVLAATNIIVPVGEISASVVLDITDDELAEGAESIEVRIVSIENGKNEAPEPLIFSIVDNDVFTDLELKGVFALRWSTETSGNSGKAVHLRAKADIADLSIYSIGVANNGGGSDSIEFTLPQMAVAAGEDILLAREDAAFLAYFGNGTSEFEHVIQTDAMNQNGDDAIELFSGTAVIQTYGDVDVDGTGMPWEYSGSWAYNFGDEWYYGGIDCAASSTTAFDSDCTYPLVANALQLQGVMSFEADPTNSGTTDRERAIHLRANRDIADLSIYGIGIANNGGGSDGREMDLPAISVAEGDHILFIRDLDTETIATYLGNCIDKFDHLAADGGINFNGDDGVELYNGMDVIEVYGDVVDDGTGLFWEYTGSWAVKEQGDVYTYGGANCAEFAATNASSPCPYAFCD
ncbi:Ig-like domain-containing protein [Marivirga sp.]|uniref:Ig-like domain-containing protein n=1 Tax=Marivirga sp. TaxID=2018662 RepID=UPI0025F626A8|nr:Ig-like domain-containing protein [Marivirga sp.]